jgi:hypothetical protein
MPLPHLGQTEEYSICPTSRGVRNKVGYGLPRPGVNHGEIVDELPLDGIADPGPHHKDVQHLSKCLEVVQRKERTIVNHDVLPLGGFASRPKSTHGRENRQGKHTVSDVGQDFGRDIAVSVQEVAISVNRLRIGLTTIQIVRPPQVGTRNYEF